MDHVKQDLRYALRTLPRSPLFAFVAILSLALGIGSATAIFSLVETALLKPLAYTAPQELISIREKVPALSHLFPTMPVNIQHFFYWREHTKALRSISAFRASNPTLAGVGEPVRVDAVETSADLFRTLNVSMQRGRAFLPDEEQPGKNQVAVITDRLWRTRFHSARGIIGTNISLEGVPATIIGVLPRSFVFPKGSDLGQLTTIGKQTDLFLPLQAPNVGWDGDYDYASIARMKPGVQLAGAFSELDGLRNQFVKAQKVDSHPRPTVQSLQELMAGPARRSLWILFSAVLALLLIVCANLANLLMARASVRAREFSIRAALGAGRMRLVQQAMTESALLSIAGGLLGVIFASAAIKLLTTRLLVELPRLDEVSLDGSVLFFALLLTVGCALLFAAVPAYHVARSDAQETLKRASSTASANRQFLSFRQLLVGLEIALSTVLLCLAGILISSVNHLLHVDKGFTEERAFSVDLGVPDSRYRTPEDRNRFFDQTLRDVRQIPGVSSAAMVVGLPLSGESHVNGIDLEGQDGKWIEASSKNNAVLINVRFISPDYFATLGIPLLRGRVIEPVDMRRPVTVISQRLAQKIWPGENPLGKRFRTGSRVGEVQVIGVVKDVHNSSLDADPTLIAYVPYTLRGTNYGSIVVRASGPAAEIRQAMRRAIWNIDSQLPIGPMRTMREIVDESMGTQRFQMQLASAFGAGALLLAIVGVYGVVAYQVAASKRELGVRLALGARNGTLISQMMWRGLRPAFTGLAVGLMASAGCGWLVRSLLFGVGPIDGWTMSLVAVALTLTAALACLLPASAVLQVDPARTLRDE